MREAILSDAARATRANLDQRDREEVNRLKFDYPRPPLTLRILDDGVWQIVYYLPDGATVRIHAISRVPDR
jgi:hypothetical protein